MISYKQMAIVATIIILLGVLIYGCNSCGKAVKKIELDADTELRINCK